MYAQLNRFSVATDLEHLLSDGFTFVIEAITEDLAAKQVLFHRIALILKRKNVPPCEVLLCSNTIGVPLHLIAAFVDAEYRSRCIGMRFLSLVMFIDEVVITYLDHQHFSTLLGHVERTLNSLKMVQYDRLAACKHKSKD